MSDGEIPTALYRLRGDEHSLLYIGISDTFGRRWNQHAQSQPWWHEVRKQEIDWYPSRDEAEDAEVAAIKAEKPRYNIMHNPGRLPPARQAASPGVSPQRAPGAPHLSLEDIDRLDPVAAMGGFDPRVYVLMATEGRVPSYADHLDFIRCCAKGAGMIDDALIAVWLFEHGETTPEKLAKVRRSARELLRLAGFSCPYCDGMPPVAMTCRGCGTDGGLPDAPGSVANQLPFLVKAMTGIQMRRSKLFSLAPEEEPAA